jgi:dihydrofolate reductase
VEIVIVAALDEGSVIGKGGALPWRLPADLKHFQRTTRGKPIVMGRKTFETLDEPLGDRLNVVMSRTEGVIRGCVVARNAEEAIEAGRAAGAHELMIIGGATIYERFLPITDRMILTVVHDEFEGDTYFPDFDGDQWEVCASERRESDERNPSAMTFVELRAVVDGPREVTPRQTPGELPEILRRRQR